MVIAPEIGEAELPAVLADEWVTHLFTDAVGLATVDLTDSAELQVVVLDDGAGRAAQASGNGVEILALPDLLR